MHIQKQDCIQTPYGVFSGIAGGEADEGRRITSLRLSARNCILTHVGELIPYYKAVTPRRKEKPSVSFHPNGMIRTVYLEQQQEIQTPIGEFPAECVTFYDTGELKRFFPQYGKISGFWSEEDERELAIPFHFQLDCTEFTARLSCVSFYKDGSIRSITLFPGESIRLQTPCAGIVQARNGFSLFQSGALRSWEPAVPTPLPTPVGRVTAYDTTAVGVQGDSGSVLLHEEGAVHALATSSDRLVVTGPDNASAFFAPEEVPSPLADDATMLVPLRLAFDAGTVQVTAAGAAQSFHREGNHFQVIPGSFGGCSPSECAGCTVCTH